MAKITQKQANEIADAIRNLNRAKEYLFNPRIVIAHRDTMATTTLHYARPDGQALYEVEKSYGSDLTGLQSGVDLLMDFLKHHTGKGMGCGGTA
jgi:hypothetical protein